MISIYKSLFMLEIWKALFSIASLSLSLLSLAVFSFSSHVLPLSFFGLSLHLSISLSLSLLFHSLRLSLSLSLSCLASLLFSCSISLWPTQLKLDSWIDHNGRSKRKMKSCKYVFHYVTHEHTYHLIRQIDELKSSFSFIILPRFCSQDISRLNKAIVMKLLMMIDLSVT